MPFIPHTKKDIAAMQSEIGIHHMDELFSEIPAELRIAGLKNVPEGIGEMVLSRLMRERALQDIGVQCFIGAGAYEHHIPAAVWDVASRGEFMTAYTPYQAEASQGTLQLLYEYQTMMANLMGLDVSNASLYDGATALGEAVLMAVRAHRHGKARRVLIAGSVHPHYLDVLKTLVSCQQIELDIIPFSASKGRIDPAQLASLDARDLAAIVIPQPNFFGMLEAVDELTDWAHQQGALVIACVNPLACALLKEPGTWGQKGVDIACGEGQPLGVPLASGGPYFGFMCCKMEWVRQMPGRIVGCTVDQEGKRGFSLTLQAREQHIRRSKATSNICTNQGLAVTAATIYMSMMGAEGLRQVALASHKGMYSLAEKLKTIKGVTCKFTDSFFHEAVIELPICASKVLEKMLQAGFLGGLDLGTYFPTLNNCLLVCVTETKSDQDIDNYVSALANAISSSNK